MTRELAIEVLNNVHYINHGGCLLAAYAFYLHEAKHGRGEDLQIVQLDRDGNDYHAQNKAFLAGDTREAWSGWHFGWTFDGGKTVYDCNGALNMKRYPYVLLVPKHMTDEFCIASLNCGDWNWAFDRPFWKPFIELKLGIDLSKVDNEVW